MKRLVSNPDSRAPARTRRKPLTFVLRVLVVLLALLTHAGLTADLATHFLGLVAYTLLLLVYLSVEARTLWMRDQHLFWMNPVILASMVTFALPFGVTNVLFFMPEDVLRSVALRPVVTQSMNQLMLLVVLGACAMWAGYCSGVGLHMGRRLKRSRMLHMTASPSVRVDRVVLWGFLAISLAARLWAMRLGVYGYASSYDQLIAHASIREYLTLAENLGKVALVAVSMQCFAPSRSALSERLLLWLVFGYEIVFGFLSGFKSAVVWPVIIVGIAYYAQRKHIPLWAVPAAVVAIIVAYAVIEPGRAARNLDTGFESTGLGSIVAIAARSTDADRGTLSSTGLAFLARSNLTFMGSQGIEYAADNDLPPDSPEFLRNILLAPAHAVIPRLIWDSKPLETIGLWYTQEVTGLKIVNSTAMGPVTYLNFAGGPIAVIVGFLVVGILQRGVFDGLRNFGGGGLIILFGLLKTLSDIDSAFNGVFVSIIRYFPLLVLAQWALLQRSSRPCRAGAGVVVSQRIGSGRTTATNTV